MVQRTGRISTCIVARSHSSLAKGAVDPWKQLPASTNWHHQTENLYTWILILISMNTLESEGVVHVSVEVIYHIVCVVYVPLLHDAPNQTWSHAEVFLHTTISILVQSQKWLLTKQASTAAPMNGLRELLHATVGRHFWPENAMTRVVCSSR